MSLAVEGGRLTAIMGASGSGKSTLMHVRESTAAEVLAAVQEVSGR